MVARGSRQLCIRAIGLIAALVLLAALSAGDVSADGAAAADGAGQLNRLIEVAVADNPDLAALRRRIEATEATVEQAGSLPDPQGIVALSNVPVGDTSLERSPMTGIQLGLRQMVPYPGRLDLKELAAEQDVVITRAIYEESENSIVRQVKRAWSGAACLRNNWLIYRGLLDSGRESLAGDLAGRTFSLLYQTPLDEVNIGYYFDPQTGKPASSQLGNLFSTPLGGVLDMIMTGVCGLRPAHGGEWQNRRLGALQPAWWVLDGLEIRGESRRFSRGVEGR